MIDSIAKIVTVDLIFDLSTWSHVIEKCCKLELLELGVCTFVKCCKPHKKGILKLNNKKCVFLRLQYLSDSLPLTI